MSKSTTPPLRPQTCKGPAAGHAFEFRNRDGTSRTLHRARVVRKMLVAFVALAALVLPSGPASAAEIYDPATARALSSSLTAAETRHMTKYLLRNILGPAVSSNTEPMSMVAAWKCRVVTERLGVCRGAVTGGAVTCRGVFRVYKFPKGYAAYPTRMNCRTGS